MVRRNIQVTVIGGLSLDVNRVATNILIPSELAFFQRRMV